MTVSVNADGSRTTYQFDAANHKATGTTVAKNGKLAGKILYKLDDLGRFSSGDVLGPKGEFRFKTLYKYNSAGLPTEEIQLGKDGTVQHKIIYAYDTAGKQTGYSAYDAAGNLISRTGIPGSGSAAPAQKPGSGHGG